MLELLPAASEEPVVKFAGILQGTVTAIIIFSFFLKLRCGLFKYNICFKDY